MRLTLPAAEVVIATPRPTSNRRVPSLSFPRATGYRANTAPPVKRTKATTEALQADAAMPYRVEGICCSEKPMPALFGPIAIKVTRKSVDLRRLRTGVMALAREHNPDDSVGVVERWSFVKIDGVNSATIIARFAETPTAELTVKEVLGHARRGISPAFLFDKVTTERTEDDEILTVLNAIEPFEASLVSQPREFSAHVTRIGRFTLGAASLSMGKGDHAMSNDTGAAPVLSNLSDLEGLSINAGRLVLAAGTGDTKQRQMLEAFFGAYDDAIGRGTTRADAIGAGKAAARIG